MLLFWCLGLAISSGTLHDSRLYSRTQILINSRVPLSTCFGRRPVYLASLLICFGSAIWRAKAQTYGSFMGACVLNGIAAGPAETIQPAVIADVMFLHERGVYQTLYFAFYFGSLMVCCFILQGSCNADYPSGWTYHRWSNGGILRMAQLLVAQCRSDWRYIVSHLFRGNITLFIVFGGPEDSSAFWDTSPVSGTTLKENY